MAKATEMTRGELESLLRFFYAESGLDFPLSDEAPDRFEGRGNVAPPEKGCASSPPAPVPAAPPRLPAIPDAEAIALARQVAEKGRDTGRPCARRSRPFEGCNLKLTARSTIFEGGPGAARR